MNSYAKDYNKLYQLQDKFLSWWARFKFPFYLTGGTALGRFYLNHRYSEDLDFFVNADKKYPQYIVQLKRQITSDFTIDTPLNILANKLSAIIGREEPKDVYDIVHIALNYSFNWDEVFEHAKEKTVINEIDVEERLFSFPTEWFEGVNWLNHTHKGGEYYSAKSNK